MQTLTFEPLIKTIGLVLPKKVNSKYGMAYTLNNKAEQYLFDYLRQTVYCVNIDLNTGPTKYACYIEYEYETSDKTIQKDLQIIIQELNKSKYHD